MGIGCAVPVHVESTVITRKFMDKSEDKAAPVFISADPSAEYFYSLTRKPENKKRKCLGCSRQFISRGTGNRLCSNCSHKAERAPNRDIAFMIQPSKSSERE